MASHTLLVLGGIASGKRQYAESLLAGADPVRRLVPGDGDGPTALMEALADATPGEVLLVEELADWLGGGRGAGTLTAEELVAAVRASAASRLVVVSAEVGLSTTPTTVANRKLAEQLGALNLALAEAADGVVLVVAGQPSWLKGSPAPVTTAVTTEAGGGFAVPGIPTPDDTTRDAATAHLASLGPVGLGGLAEVVRFAAAAQATPVPRPWSQVRVLVLHGDHPGAQAAGAIGSADRARRLRDGSSPLAQLASAAGARVELVPTEPAAPIEDGPAMPEAQVDAALAAGARLAERAVDEGADLIVLGSIGAGAETAAAAVTAALIAGAEPPALLGRVRTTDGRIDDAAWIRRCTTVRDAVFSSRRTGRSGARAVLAALGGPDLAVATGVILAAAARRTPIMIDGPVGAAAAVAARNLVKPVRHWLLLPDAGGHPLVARVASLLGLSPLLDLKLELDEGATALTTLPLLHTALRLAAMEPVGHGLGDAPMDAASAGSPSAGDASVGDAPVGDSSVGDPSAPSSADRPPSNPPA